MRRRHAPIPIPLTVLLLGACTAEPGERVEIDMDATEPVALEQPRTVALEEEARPEAAPPDRSRYPGLEEVREEGLERDPEPLTIRDDGRPSWWFAGTRRDGNAVLLCAEALGPDMRDARAAAIDAARARLRQSLELHENEPMPEIEIRRTWVWPLPHASTGTAARYAGYVLIGAADGE